MQQHNRVLVSQYPKKESKVQIICNSGKKSWRLYKNRNNL